jgi:hypothetical protein
LLKLFNPNQTITNLKQITMRKIIFTFLVALLSVGLSKAQITYEDIMIIADFEGDPAEHSYTLGGWGMETEIVDNPLAEGLNESDKVLKQTREPGSWNSATDVTFTDALQVEERNTLRVKVYAENDVYVYFRALDAEGGVLAETWGASPAPAGEWSYAMLSIGGIAEIHGVRIEFSSNWGNTGDDDNLVAYFDEIEISKAVIPMGDPDRIYVAKMVTEPIEIDGFDMEDDWLEIDPTPIENVNYVLDGQTSVPAQGSSFRALWDDDYLYLFIEIADNSPTAPSGEQWWNYDGVEIFVDGQHRIAPGGRLAGQYQIRINYDTPTLSGQDGATVALFMDNGMEWAQGTMAGGYTLEVKLPWVSIHGGAEDAGPANITFDLAIADEDPAIQANRYTNVIWAGDDGSHHPYESSEFWGAIHLDGLVSAQEVVKQVNSLKVYPSPARDYIRVEMDNLHTWELVSITGAVVKRGVASSDQVRIDLDQLSSGMYFVRALARDGNVEIRKITRQ